MTETCPEHLGQRMDLYCENCGSVICILCKVNSHFTHNVIPLSKKCKILKRKLKHFQRDVSKKREILEWHCSSLKSFPTEKIKETIHAQYCNVKKLLFEAYQRQIDEIDKASNVEQKKCIDEELRLNNLRSVDDRVTELLSNYSHSSSFIQQSNVLLLNLTDKSWKTREFFPSTPIYVPPGEQYMRLSEDFFTVAESLLGHCKKIGFQTQTDFRSVRRCQSLVNMSTFTRAPKMSGSNSMSSISPSVLSSTLHRSASELDFRGYDQFSSEVCFCVFV